MNPVNNPTATVCAFRIHGKVNPVYTPPKLGQFIGFFVFLLLLPLLIQFPTDQTTDTAKAPSAHQLERVH